MKINYFLEKSGKRKIDLVKGTGIAQSTISDYTSGKTLPNAGNLQKIADYFGIFKSDIDPRFSDDSEAPQSAKFSADLENSINHAENYSGKPLSDTDKQILRGVIEAYLANRNN